MPDLEVVAFVVLVLGSIAETGLYFFATPALARLAFVPLGTFTADIGPEGQELLSGRKAAALAMEGMPRETTSYREGPAAPLAKAESIVEALRFEPREETDATLVYSTPSRDEVVVRLPFKFFGTRTYGLARTKLVFDGHRVTATTRFLPVPSLSYALATLFFFAGTATTTLEIALAAPAFLLVVLAVNGLISYVRLRGPLQMLRLRIEGGLHSLR